MKLSSTPSTPKTAKLLMQPDTSSIKEGRDHYEIEHRIVRKGTGEIRYVFEKCEHIRDATGMIVKSVGMVHDITERKKAEERCARRGTTWTIC